MTPANAERAVDVFRMAVLPKVQELDGFCSASLLISREAGRVVGTITFDSREQLEATREAAARIREAASKDTGSDDRRRGGDGGGVRAPARA